MTPTSVIDTNVLVSGLVTNDPKAPTLRIVDGMRKAEFRYLLSVRLLAEYREALLRPHLQASHKKSEAAVDAILAEFVVNAIMREEAATLEPAPDPDDDHLFALLATEPGAILVTGDQALHRHPPGKASVLSPRAFVELLEL